MLRYTWAGLLLSRMRKDNGRAFLVCVYVFYFIVFVFLDVTLSHTVSFMYRFM